MRRQRFWRQTLASASVACGLQNGDQVDEGEVGFTDVACQAADIMDAMAAIKTAATDRC